MSDSQGFVTNQDGSITVVVDGKSITYVKESDLGAVKAALKDKESEVSQLQANLATANSKFDAEHQEVLKVRASLEELEKQSGENSNLKEQLEKLTKEKDEVNTNYTSLSDKYLGRVKNGLMTRYKLDESKLEGKGLSDLEQMEEVLSTVGGSGNGKTPANYDGGGNGTTGTPSELQGKTPMSLATMAYENTKHKEK